MTVSNLPRATTTHHLVMARRVYFGLAPAVPATSYDVTRTPRLHGDDDPSPLMQGRSVLTEILVLDLLTLLDDHRLQSMPTEQLPFSLTLETALPHTPIYGLSMSPDLFLAHRLTVPGHRLTILRIIWPGPSDRSPQLEFRHV